MAISLMKQYGNLVKNVSSFTDGQVQIPQESEGIEDTLETLFLTFSPKSGPYRGGNFSFTFTLDGFPQEAPTVICNTAIYHPNIDIEGEVCLNLLDEMWSSSITLEDVVQGILFLFYNPNLDDPLNSLFDGAELYDEFKMDVRESLKGGTVAGYQFERNLPEGFIDEDTEVCGEDEDSVGNALSRLFENEDQEIESTVNTGTDSSDDFEGNVRDHGEQDVSNNNHHHSDVAELPAVVEDEQIALSNSLSNSRQLDRENDRINSLNNITFVYHRYNLMSLMRYLVGILSHARNFLRTKATFWSFWTYRTCSV